ncbi:hypothetical protein SCHPADRAFT_937055 [Schizopora paradoxa]|uniref:Uncharacterized protein n=1 Tax=Schizopora paradoxa TaxID=27342 RepID=A0A0H2S6P1_9AGAM|nr:hypothetical protein SCHPADRAFT_937055 [Schizopora paradoxa]
MDRNEAEPEYIDIRLENIRVAYHALARRIRTVLLNQADDERRMSVARREVLEFGHEVHIIADIIPYQELLICLTSLASMVTQLDDACTAARDRPHASQRFLDSESRLITIGEMRCRNLVILLPGDRM